MPTQQETTRPAMRRKSSAQNILSSFKSSSSSIHSQSPVSSTSYFTSPTANPSMARDWDGNSATDSTTTLQNPSATLSPSLGGQGTSAEFLRDLVQKRITTLTYMRDVHEGRAHWFHTILMSRADLDKVFNNVAMKKRTYRFAILGMSLSNLLDIQQPQDLIRSIMNTMSEYEQSKEEGDKLKKRLFSNNKPRKRGYVDPTLSYPEAYDASCLLTPHIPFPLDYHEALISLLSILSSIYAKFSKILGPSPFQHPQHMMGPLGLLSPHPGVSYLFKESEGGEIGGSLWAIANASVGNTSTAGLTSPPCSWTPALGDAILKADGKFKKIISTLLKELDAFARNGMKDELATFDPLLRNVAVADNRREQYDFEGNV